METTTPTDMQQWHSDKADKWQATAERHLAKYHRTEKEYLLELHVASLAMADYHRVQAQTA
jgi:hypothetical protein